MTMGLKAHEESVRGLLGGGVQLQVPPYQREYRWTEDEQWRPLWEDVRVLLEDEAVAGHFLSTVVLIGPMAEKGGSVTRWKVIDGQQRVTTLTLLIKGAARAMLGLGQVEIAQSLETFTENAETVQKRDPAKRWKITGSIADKEDYERAMREKGTGRGRGGAGNRFAKCIEVFEGLAHGWLVKDVEDEDPGKEAQLEERCTRLEHAILDRIMAVKLQTTNEEAGPQIFTSLNGRGVELTDNDLCRSSFLGLWKDDHPETTDETLRTTWPLEGGWWHEKDSRSQVIHADRFLTHYLTYRRAAQCPHKAIWKTFEEVVRSQFKGNLTEMKEDMEAAAELYKVLMNADKRDAKSQEGRFGALGIGTMHPVLMAMGKEEALRGEGGKLVERYYVRRIVAGMHARGLNKLVEKLLGAVKGVKPGPEVTARIDHNMRGETRKTYRWPTDGEMAQGLHRVRYQGNIPRIRIILMCLEEKLRRERWPEAEPVDTSGAEIDHLWPQQADAGWRANADGKDAADIDNAIQTMGNLTLLTPVENKRLGNCGAPDKIGRICRESKLCLNAALKDAAPDGRWTLDRIAQRTAWFAQQIAEEWPAAGEDGAQRTGKGRAQGSELEQEELFGARGWPAGSTGQQHGAEGAAGSGAA